MSKSMKLLILIVVIVILIAIVYHFMFRKKDEVKTETKAVIPKLPPRSDYIPSLNVFTPNTSDLIITN